MKNVNKVVSMVGGVCGSMFGYGLVNNSNYYVGSQKRGVSDILTSAGGLILGWYAGTIVTNKIYNDIFTKKED